MSGLPAVNLVIALCAAACSTTAVESRKADVADKSERPDRRTETRVSSGGMTVAISRDGDALIVAATSPTSGWLAVGFNNKPELAGARLVMGAIVEGEALLEEHIADPPNHKRRARGRTPTLIESSQDERGTRIVFRLARDPADPQRPQDRLDLSRPLHLIVAYSMDGDFNHHSAHRAAFEVTID